MITLLAPYGRNEVTSAAIRLADLAMGLGRDVRLVACGLKESSVHPSWDDKVRTGQRTGIYKAAHKASCVVHFQCHQSWYAKAALVADGKKAKHILVPNWHGLGPRDKAVVAKFDQVVCPTRACKKAIQSEVFQGDRVGRDLLTWVRWDAGIPPVRREGTVADERIRACVYADSASIDFCGPLVVHLVDELLTQHPRLDVTVISVKSWSRKDKHDLRAAEKKWSADKRLAVRRVGTLPDLTKEFHAHDWVVLPSVRADFGMAASRALACGAAVIAHDIEPFSEIVTEASGLLVPCEWTSGRMLAPVAVPSMARWLETCDRAFSDTKLLFKLQTWDWKLTEHQAAFNLAWSRIWDG